MAVSVATHWSNQCWANSGAVKKREQPIGKFAGEMALCERIASERTVLLDCEPANCFRRGAGKWFPCVHRGCRAQQRLGPGH